MFYGYFIMRSGDTKARGPLQRAGAVRIEAAQKGFDIDQDHDGISLA
jgi:hypothetical protein